MQMAAGGTIAVGMVLVLLLGEIDLSVGVVSGMCAAAMAVLTVRSGLAAPIAIAIALGSGFVTGAAQGAWIAGFGVPSLIVTLSGLMTWHGSLLEVLGKTSTANLPDSLITQLAGT